MTTAAGRAMEVDDVSRGARAQNAAGLERLSRRIVPSVGWDDLVLPAVVEQQLRELTARARHRDRVVGEWIMGTKGARGLGITGLFAGDSGTGKTLSAEVLAGDLGLDLYVIDLSTVIDKYIGETEKNLDRIFTEADGVNGVLLFDEADALFGKRSEVKDARDFNLTTITDYLSDGDPWADMDAHAYPLEPLLDLWQALLGGELNWPPDYPKQPGEPPRVQPSKKVVDNWDEQGHRITS